MFVVCKFLDGKEVVHPKTVKEQTNRTNTVYYAVLSKH